MGRHQREYLSACARGSVVSRCNVCAFTFGIRKEVRQERRPAPLAVVLLSCRWENKTRKKAPAHCSRSG